MTPTTWLFGLAILWTIAADNQTLGMDSLVMAIYIQEDQSTRITFTDRTGANVDDLKLPLDETVPSFIVLLCGDEEENSKNEGFKIIQITDKIDSILKYTNCDHHSQAYVNVNENTNPIRSTSHSIGFREAAGIESLKLLLKFTKLFNIYSEPFRHDETYLKIHYDFTLNIPKLIEHTVKARMHSYTNNEECKKIDIRSDIVNEKRSNDDLVAQFKPEKIPSNHQWRQLVSMQDFKGIYTTQATCIYLNYILLHEDAIKNLNDIEIYIRMIADVINEVNVVTGTYIKEDNNPHPKTDNKGNTIPTIVWKNISYSWNNKRYDILVVIHNKQTERICNQENTWGWPNSSKNSKETRTGTMYCCSMNSKLNEQLGLDNRSEYLPLNLKKVPYQQKEIDVAKIISKKSSSNNVMAKWLSRMTTCFHPQERSTKNSP